MPTAELKQAETISREIKSGVIAALDRTPGGMADFGATSKSEMTDIELWFDPETDCAMLKIRYWGEHSQLERVPQATRYPHISGNALVEIIEAYLQKEKADAHTGTQASTV